ncbi:sugar phosphate nucleotidyltransferase [Marispirochaeta sp.]|uniref:mannose-1-phosphate guanylyltransferase n=1 Tax=Marispirochaeta sp. TaxID=2038653 RepID=UPI0029C94111|nr:sugar phosphate nucleotidyltransferase [Marispirochaeta sp.]
MENSELARREALRYYGSMNTAEITVPNVMILAGGSGTRLWPASTREVPKQYMTVRDGKSLLRLTIERAAALNPKRIMIVTLASQAGQAGQELKTWSRQHQGSLPELLVLPEPAGRNTAPAIAAGAAAIQQLGGAGEAVLVLPADHLIEPVERFIQDVAAASFAANDGSIVTFGISPTRPETGYGYIEAGDQVSAGLQKEGNVREVRRFREKPDPETARQFLDAGNYTWNSGMFLFRLDFLAPELEKHAPAVSELYRALTSIPAGQHTDVVSMVYNSPDVAQIYTNAPSISIDYAVMEKTRRAAVLPASFTWNDIGSWDEYARVFPENAPARGDVSSEGCFVLSDLPVSLVGVQDLIVVIRNGRALVCRKGESQEVKEALNSLPEEWR